MNTQRLRRYASAGLVLLGLVACSLADERVAVPTAERRPTSAPSAVAAAPTPKVPTPTFVPVGGDVPPASPPASSPPAAGGDAAAPLLLEDTAWQGGYRRASGNSVYGGRTATWIYGSSTQYNTMQAIFELTVQPGGMAELSIEGMDSEGAAKTPIRISVNNTEIFNGPNPLPDDDLPLDTGTWATYTWRFDAVLLRPGRNVIGISNLAPGAFSRPPFFMLDYAHLRF
ncbi:MAG TPA: hypothetical protein VFZ66_14235 [Herpetosiphonaceae bacterium]